MDNFKNKNSFSKLLWIPIIALSIYLLSIAYMYFFQRSFLYHPLKEVNGLAHYKLSNTEEVFLTADDGTKIQAWFRTPDNGCDMTIFLHGNYGSLDDRADKLKQLADMGYGFIIPAWRSFGKSEGEPNMENLYSDARTVIKFAASKGYNTENIIMIGESLGTGIATKMANEFSFKGLFLITPYTSIADRAGEIYPGMPTKTLTKDNYKVLENIATIKQPLLIIHGTNDTIIPHSHSEKIIAAAMEPKKLVIYPGIGHSNYNIKAVFTEMKNYFGIDCSKSSKEVKVEEHAGN